MNQSTVRVYDPPTPTKVLLTLNDLLKVPVERGTSGVSVKTTLGAYIAMSLKEEIVELPNNRGLMGARQQTVDNVRYEFNLVGLGTLYASPLWSKGVVEMIEGNGRRKGLVLRFNDGEFTQEDLSSVINLILIHELDRRDAYELLNAHEKHSFLDRLTDKNNQVGAIWTKFNKELPQNLPLQWAGPLFDFPVALQEGTIPMRNETDEGGKLISPVAALRNARGRMLKKLNQPADEFDYTISGFNIKRAADAITKVVAFRDQILELSTIRNDDGSLKLSKKGNVIFTDTGKLVENTLGIVSALVLDQIQSGEPQVDLSTPLATNRAAKNALGYKRSDKEDFVTELINDGKMMAKKDTKGNVLKAYDRILTKISRTK
jgi:hypothetical protein